MLCSCLTIRRLQLFCYPGLFSSSLQAVEWYFHIHCSSGKPIDSGSVLVPYTQLFVYSIVFRKSWSTAGSTVTGL